MRKEYKLWVENNINEVKNRERYARTNPRTITFGDGPRKSNIFLLIIIIVMTILVIIIIIYHMSVSYFLSKI